MRKLTTGILSLSVFVSVLFIAPASHAVTTTFDPTGTYTIDFTCSSGCSGTYTHTMNITSFNSSTGDFTGTGFYNADPSYTWDVVGNVSGNMFTYTLTYTGTNSGYEVSGTGTLAPNGTLSGNGTSNAGQTFDMVSTSGAAIVMNAPSTKDECKNGGWMNFNNPTFKNQGLCVSYMVNHSSVH